MMNMQTRYLSFAAIWIVMILLPCEVYAQLADTTGMGTGSKGTTRYYNYDARTVAMGDAAISDYAGLSTVKVNPANLGFVHDMRTIQINTSQSMHDNRMAHNLTMPLFAGRGHHRVAGQLTMYHQGVNGLNFLRDTERDNFQDSNIYQFDLAYAWTHDNTLSIGVMNNVSLAYRAGRQYWTYYPVVGVLYSPESYLSYGAVFRAPGNSIVYYTGTQWPVFDIERLNSSMEIGASFRFPIDEQHPYLALNFSNEKLFGEEGLYYKGGIEIYVTRNIALRSGFIFHNTERNYTPRFGLGIGRSNIKVDYALAHKDENNERFHQLGVTYRF